METKNYLSHPIFLDFLKLTSFTYPYGFEHQVVELLGIHLNKDYYGNYYYKIGDDYSTMFTSHLDTVGEKKKVKHIVRNNRISSDGTSILGADDKSGVALMLHMIRNNVNGLYYFFIGEEVGRIGSLKLASNLKENGLLSNITKIISFDRKGVDSVITHQLGKRTASDIFAKHLSEELNSLEPSFNYKIDNTGVYTDSYSFENQIKECTNLSVDYFNQHTTNEYQLISHLILLGEALYKINWEQLSIAREILKA